MREALVVLDAAIWLRLGMVHYGDGVELRPLEAGSSGGREKDGVAKYDVGEAQLGAGVQIIASGLVVSFVEGSEEKGLMTLLVEVRARVGRALGELRLQVRPVFMVVEEGLEVRDWPEFGTVSCSGEALGLEDSGEVVVERPEDGVIVGGALGGDAVLEERARSVSGMGRHVLRGRW